MVYFRPVAKDFAELNTSAARKLGDRLDDLAAFLGIDREHLDEWLQGVHGRTKLPNTFGRLWPADPDEPRDRLEMAEELGELRNSDARHEPELRVELAQLLGAAPSVVEEDLRAEHHRSRLDRCAFETSEAAYRAALKQRRGPRKTGPRAAEPIAEPATSESALPPEIASLRVSDARHDDLVLFRLADALDLSPGAVRAALDRAHHRQRLDRVDFSTHGPTQELLLAPRRPSPNPASSCPCASASTSSRPSTRLPFRAGIRLFQHQLAPLRKALELPRVNLFIADDVGLGKTIEAGLVMQELLLRQRLDFILIVTPAAITLQWRDEMERRFGPGFEIYNRAFVARRRKQRGYGVNPWTTHNRFIISYQTPAPARVPRPAAGRARRAPTPPARPSKTRSSSACSSSTPSAPPRRPNSAPRRPRPRSEQESTFRLVNLNKRHDKPTRELL